MNFPLSSSIYKERLRALKPCKPRAPTEYNTAYKKWVPITKETCLVSVLPRKKKPKKREEFADNTSQWSASTGYPGTSISGDFNDAASTGGSSLGQPDLLSEEWFENQELTSSLRAKSATMHKRSQVEQVRDKAMTKYTFGPREKNRVSVDQLPPEDIFPYRLQRLNMAAAKARAKYAKYYRKGGCPAHARLAWKKKPGHYTRCPIATPTNVKEPNKEKDKSSPERINMGDLCRAIDRIDDWSISDDDGPELICAGELPGKVPQERSESVISVVPFDKSSVELLQEPFKPQWRLGSPEKKRKSYVVEGIDETDVKSLYQNISSEDLKRVKKSCSEHTGKDKEQNKPRVKSCREEWTAAPSKRKTDYSYLCRPARDWRTTYGNEYQFRPNVQDEYVKLNTHSNPESRSVLLEKSASDTFSQHGGKTPIIKVKKKKTKKDTNAVKESSIEGKNSDENKPASLEVNGDRVLQEAEKIAERAYNSKLSVDGKAKLESEKSSEAYKPWKVKQREIPRWAEKNMKSLGSAHWILHNVSYPWRVNQNYVEGGEDFRTSPSTVLPRKVNTDSIREDQEACDKKKNARDDEQPDPFISLYYPHLRTNSTYLTEYMRRYHPLPLPTRQVLA